MGVQQMLKNTTITNNVRATLISSTLTVFLALREVSKLLLWLRTVLNILR